MNALNETVVNQLGDALDKANSDDSVRTVFWTEPEKHSLQVLTSSSLSIKSAQIPSQIFDFTANGHVVQNKLESSSKTTLLATG